MERTHLTSTVLRNYFRTYSSKLCILACCGALLATMGCGKPLAYHLKHYHRPFAAIAKSNQTYFHSGQTGRIIAKDPCASYCEPGCYGYEPTTWTHWPEQCPGKFPVQGETFEESIESYDGGYYDNGVIGAPVIMDSSQSQSIPAPAPMSAQVENGTTTAPASRVGSGVPAPPSVSKPSSIPADVESSAPSPSDATRTPSSVMPFTRATPANVKSPVGDEVAAPPTSTLPVSPPILTPPQSIRSTAPPLSLPPVAKPQMKLRSVLSHEKETDRTVDVSSKPELPVRVLVADSTAKTNKSLATLRRTPPVEASQSADSLKKIRMTSGQPITSSKRIADSKGASLSQKLFTVRELDKAKKITVDKTKIETQPLKSINPPKSKKALSGLPLAKKVVPSSSKPKKIDVSEVPKSTPAGLRLAKKVRPKSALKVQPSKTVATKVVDAKATKVEVAASKTAATKKPVAKSTLKIKKPVVAEPVKLAAKTAQPEPALTKAPLLQAPAQKVPAKLQKPVAPVFVKKTIRRPKAPRLTPIQLDMSSMQVKVKSVSQPIIASKSKPLAKSRVATPNKKRQATVVMKAKAEGGDSMLEFAKDPPRRELRVTSLPDSGPSIRFK